MSSSPSTKTAKLAKVPKSSSSTTKKATTKKTAMLAEATVATLTVNSASLDGGSAGSDDDDGQSPVVGGSSYPHPAQASDVVDLVGRSSGGSSASANSNKKRMHKSGGSGGHTPAPEYMKTSRIKWIAAKGGVITLGKEVYPSIRAMVNDELNRVVEKAVAQCGYSRRRMVSAEDVMVTFEKLNINYKTTANENDYEACKSFRATTPLSSETPDKAAREGSRVNRATDAVSYYQNQQQCFMLHRKPFTSMITNMSRHYTAEVRWSSSASAVLQAYVEGWMTKLFSCSVACAKYRNPNRVTIKLADIHQGRLVLSGAF